MPIYRVVNAKTFCQPWCAVLLLLYICAAMRSTLSTMALKGSTLPVARSRSCIRHLCAASHVGRAPLAVTSIHKPFVSPLLACFQPSAFLFRDCIFTQRASSRTPPHVRHSSSLTGSQPFTDSGDGGKGLPPLNGGGGGGGSGDGEGSGDQPERVVLPTGKTVDNLPAGMLPLMECLCRTHLFNSQTCNRRSLAGKSPKFTSTDSSA